MGKRVPVRWAHSRSIEEHVDYIIQVKNKSRNDLELRNLAIKLTSSSFVWTQDPRTGRRTAMVQAWNKWFVAPRGDICAPRDDICEIIKIWDFVVANVRYVYDPPYVDTFATSKVTLELGGGDCDDFTILFANLLESIGFHMQARVISTPDDPKNWVHIYPMVGLPKEPPESWLPLDATVQGYRPGDQWPQIAKYIDFPM